MNLSKLILKNLNYNEEFTRKVLPFLKLDYFKERSEKIIFTEISSFVSEYSNIPTYEALVIQLNEKSLGDDEFKETLDILNEETLYAILYRIRLCIFYLDIIAPGESCRSKVKCCLGTARAGVNEHYKRSFSHCCT